VNHPQICGRLYAQDILEQLSNGTFFVLIEIFFNAMSVSCTYMAGMTEELIFFFFFETVLLCNLGWPQA
jgi:hypothetical protein